MDLLKSLEKTASYKNKEPQRGATLQGVFSFALLVKYIKNHFKQRKNKAMIKYISFLLSCLRLSFMREIDIFSFYMLNILIAK